MIRDSVPGEKFKSSIRADDKVVIITGANSGLGYETARELARRGAHIYMACRNMKKCEKAREELILECNSERFYCRECDLSSQTSIREFVQK